ncbi:hypothetical protein HPB52_005999 [Rhipicephalus sanguineus]|uniref:Uncharacterized protein n=1 Tax=Rhipicephalus sanguineus TaxID=34632 RepID=A0A9D4PUX5_RHISA|nr:hypothetical protein HPB52_005999 [Rhipicephalus sanguineus]
MVGCKGIGCFPPAEDEDDSDRPWWRERFGSLVRTNSGVLLNDEMDDFSTPGKPNLYGLAPSSANFIEPAKRPMSSMAPMVLVDSEGKVQLSLGGTGGPLITSGISLRDGDHILANSDFRKGGTVDGE